MFMKQIKFYQQAGKMQQTNKSQNESHFSFQSFRQAQPQSKNIYSYPSDDIKAGMTDKPIPQTTETKFYINNIFHSTHKYEVPVRSCSRRSQGQASYNQFYSNFRKFTKPYGENTKFSDSVSRNCAIVRRGPCDIPLPVDLPKKTSHNYLRAKRTIRYSKVQHKTTGNILATESKKKTSEINSQLFEKTVDSQYVIFKRLFAKERSGKRDRVGLNNSMNRLLAAEIIESQIRPRNYSRAVTEHS